MQKPLIHEWRYDGTPSFRLNSIRREYRNLFAQMINRGHIELRHVETCPCGSKEFRNISNKDRFGLPFHNIICLQCGLLITSPRIAENSLEKYYKEIYYPLVLGIKENDNYSYIVSAEQGRKIYDYCKDFIVKMGQRNLKILEIGCSSGANLIDFDTNANQMEITCELSGLEYEKKSAKLAMARGIKVIEGGIDLLSTKNVKYDLIILSHVFEHFDDLNLALQHIKKAMHKDGLIYVEVPGVMNKETMEGYNNDFTCYTVHAHTYNFNLTSLRNVFCMNGFETIKGDEFVRAIFVLNKEDNLDKKLIPSNYEKTISYLISNFQRIPRDNKKTIISYIKASLWKVFYLYFQERPDLGKYHL